MDDQLEAVAMSVLVDVPVKVYVVITVAVLSFGALMLFIRWYSNKVINRVLEDKNNQPGIVAYPYIWVFIFVLGFYSRWSGPMRYPAELVLGVIAFVILLGILFNKLRDNNNIRSSDLISVIIFMLIVFIFTMGTVGHIEIPKNFFKW